MKYISTLSLIVLFAFNSLAQEKSENKDQIIWKTVEDAQKASKKDGKPIIIDAHTVWCGPCKLLSKITFKDSAVVAYVNENFHAVKFNAEGNLEIKFNGVTYKNPGYNPEYANRRNAQHELARKLKVNAYPTILFVNKNGEVFNTALGYLDPTRMMDLLQKIVKKGEN